ncbi:uncharacterized protein N7511_008449 [Penicillium nucicola]|uniref:uncharacterized protein n=1 Tax=Penicillium nucicola TaxID=1850975 RepID=UPI0025454EF5|nr:uncharacterized protein N7511_008449 [Penicillium nucicola]KAJ5751484.1 hypothetical protein N7511_008449 [Penicillium nucicola]
MANAVNPPCDLTGSVDSATQASIDLLEGIQTLTPNLKPLRDLASELESLKAVLESLGKTIQTSTDTNLLKLVPPLNECRMTCNWFCRAGFEPFGQAVMSGRCGRGSSDRHRVGSYRRHIDNLRRILSGYTSTFQVVLSAPKIQDPFITMDDLGVIKKLITNTIEDLKDLKNDAEERSSLSAKVAFPGETRPVNQKASIFDYCRDLCASFLDELNQVEATLADRASHSKKVPADEAWESTRRKISQVFVSPKVYAINRGNGSGLQIQFAGLATQQEIMECSRAMAQMWPK